MWMLSGWQVKSQAALPPWSSWNLWSRNSSQKAGPGESKPKRISKVKGPVSCCGFLRVQNLKVRRGTRIITKWLSSKGVPDYIQNRQYDIIQNSFKRYFIQNVSFTDVLAAKSSVVLWTMWTMCDEHLALFCGKTQNVCLWNGGQKLQMWTMSLPQSSSHLKLVILKWTHLSHGYEDHLEMQWHILHCKSQVFSCTSLSCWLTTQKNTLRGPRVIAMLILQVVSQVFVCLVTFIANWTSFWPQIKWNGWHSTYDNSIWLFFVHIPLMWHEGKSIR